MSVRPVSGLRERDIAAWRELAERAAEPNPFFEPEFLVPAARWVGDESVGLLVAEDAGGWVACVPLRPAPRWGMLRLPLLTGWRHEYSYLGTPLIDAERVYQALGAMVARAARDYHAAGVMLNWVGVGGAVSGALRQVVDSRALGVGVYHSFERATVTRRPEPTYLDRSLSSKRRKELRRLERRLGDELGGTMEVADRGGEGAGAAATEFARLEASGWKGRRGTALASSDAHARFFAEVCRNFAEVGRLQLLSLETEGRSAAMQCNLIAGEGLFCFKVAYDEELARFSPGIQLEVKSVDVFHETPSLGLMDSCSDPRNELLNRLWPDQRRISSIVVTGGGAVGQSALAGVRVAARMRERRAADQPAPGPAR